MDQAVVAGVGNVYRAEVLFRHRLDPMRPGNTVRRSSFERLWHDLVLLMADGVRTGRIETVHVRTDPDLVGRVQQAPTAGDGDPDDSPVFVYRRQGEPCLVCGSRVRTAGACRSQPVLVPEVPAPVPFPRREVFTGVAKRHGKPAATTKVLPMVTTVETSRATGEPARRSLRRTYNTAVRRFRSSDVAPAILLGAACVLIGIGNY